MGMKVTLEAIEVKRQKLLDICNHIQKLADTPGEHGEEIVKEANVAQREAQELEAMAKVWEQQELADRRAPTAEPYITVKLNDDQRERILEETGVRMETVDIPDGTQIMERTMPVNQPPDIERIALEQARAQKALKEGEQAAMAEAAQGLAALKAQKNPEMDKLVDKALKDPNFLCGLFSKK